MEASSILLALFVASAVGQGLAFRGARNDLLKNHPDTYLEVERSSSWPGWGMQKFIYFGRHKQLGDKTLSHEIIATRSFAGLALFSFFARIFVL